MSNKSSGGLSFMSVLQIIFIVLKLTNLVAWPWGVVLIPLWIDLALIVIILFGVYMS